jgi:hypothetical protein
MAGKIASKKKRSHGAQLQVVHKGNGEPASNEVREVPVQRIYQAIRNGNVPKLKTLVGNDAGIANSSTVLSKDGKGPAPFNLPTNLHEMHVVGAGAYEMPVETLSILPPLDAQWPLLLVACLHPNDTFLQAVLSAGADVNVTLDKWTAATISCIIHLPLERLVARYC